MKYISLLIIAILISCDKDEPLKEDVNSKLIGSWDAYYGIYPDGPVDGLQYAVLFNYEHGFEILKEGIYKSRYAKGLTLDEGWVTSSNSEKWELKNDTLSFIYTDPDGVSDSLHFLILTVDKNELRIKSIGRGADFQEVIPRTIYLRRSNS
jgi:hypothetical protein